MHPSKFNGRIDPLKKPLGRRRQICEKDTHTYLQIKVLLFSLVFLLVIVQGGTMGKLVSIVTTCLVVLEQQILFLEKLAEATDHTTDRHGHDGLSQGLISKHLEKLKIGY